MPDGTPGCPGRPLAERKTLFGPPRWRTGCLTGVHGSRLVTNMLNWPIIIGPEKVGLGEVLAGLLGKSMRLVGS